MVGGLELCVKYYPSSHLPPRRSSLPPPPSLPGLCSSCWPLSWLPVSLVYKLVVYQGNAGACFIRREKGRGTHYIKVSPLQQTVRVTNQRLSRPTASAKQIRKNEEKKKKKDEAYFTRGGCRPGEVACRRLSGRRWEQGVGGGISRGRHKSPFFFKKMPEKQEVHDKWVGHKQHREVPFVKSPL